MKMQTMSITDALRSATREELVSVQFNDGRIVDGAILFNESKGVGKVINVEKEVSVDFRVEQIASVRM